MKQIAFTTPTFPPFSGSHFKHLAALTLCVVGGLAAYHAGAPEALSAAADPDAMAHLIDTIGPIAVVVFLALAVVISPVPSAPIAMAAGALYGPFEGGALTAAGAVLGAMIAFGLSRWIGYRPLCASKLPAAHWITRPRTQMRLALVVLGSRLIPFISFDAVSYVAGLTSIRPLNFAMATTLGILPASWAFAALGAGAARADNVVLMIAACGITLMLPIAWILVRGVCSSKS